MGKRYVFSIEEELDNFQLTLAEHIGPAAYYINILWLADRLLEMFFYGEPLADVKCVERFLEGLKIPTEKTEDLSASIKCGMQRKIFHCIPDFDDTHSYSYKVTNLGDVVVDDLGCVVMTGTSLEKTFIDEIEQNIANGDYVPERYRRLVG